MASASSLPTSNSSPGAARKPRPAEIRRPGAGALWLLASLPVLCLATYPAAVLLRFIFWAGAGDVVCLSAYLMLLVHQGIAPRPERGDGPSGGARRPRPTETGPLPAGQPAGSPLLPGLLASVGVAFLAVAADQADVWTALVCGLMAGAGVLLIWLFLPWIASDAEAGQLSLRAPADPLLRHPHRGLLPRGGLGFLLLLGFLLYGLGAVWAWGEQRVPDPLPWLLALAVTALLLQFAERFLSLARSARDGNLVIVAHAPPRWVASACALFALAALVAAFLPWKPSPPRPADARIGTAVRLFSTIQPIQSSARQLTEQAIASAGGAAATLASAPRHLLLLWLLLLLLFVALLLVWVFHRTRAGRAALAAFLWLVDRLLRAWRGLCLLPRRTLRRGRAAAGVGAMADDRKEATNPLFDIFTDAQALSRLSARDIIIRTYHLMLNLAEMLGCARRPGQTPFEYAQRLSAVAPSAEGAISAITWGYAGAMYGAEDAELPAVTAVKDLWQRVSQALTAGLSPEDLSLRRQRYLAAIAVESAHRPRR